MKLRTAAIVTAALLTFAMLAGCKNAPNANGSNAANGNTEASNTQAKPAGTPVSASSPSAAFNAYYEAVKKKDIVAVRSLFSKDTMIVMEERAKATNKDVDTLMKEGLESANKDIPPSPPETRNEKIEGDTASIEVRDEKANKWATLHFIREDGSWKLSFPKRTEN